MDACLCGIGLDAIRRSRRSRSGSPSPDRAAVTTSPRRSTSARNTEGNVEVKWTGPDGIMLDVSKTGWLGTPTCGR
jgi:hypothetical protein